MNSLSVLSHRRSVQSKQTPPDELLLEKHFKKALEKKKKRWQRKFLQAFATNDPFSDRDSSALPSETVNPFHYELPFADVSHEPTTVSYLSRSQLLKLLHSSPVVDGILVYSSASAIANLYSAVRLERPAWVNRHITPLRDIFSSAEMEHLYKMCRRDYSFIFIGKDLHKMRERLQDPEKYYSNPNRPSKLRVWMVVINITSKPPISSPPPSFPLGKWLFPPGPLTEHSRGLKWNTDPDIHVEWYNYMYRRYRNPRFPLHLPETTGFLWDWDKYRIAPLLDYIIVDEDPNVIRREPFQNKDKVWTRLYESARYDQSRMLGYFQFTLEDWAILIHISTSRKAS